MAKSHVGALRSRISRIDRLIEREKTKKAKKAEKDKLHREFEAKKKALAKIKKH
jgi:hypothetical protein